MPNVLKKYFTISRVSVLLVIFWFLVAAIGGPFFSRVSEVVSNEQANFLPASAEATKAQTQLKEFVATDQVPAILVLTSSQKISETQIQSLNETVQALTEVAGVAGEISPVIPSQDGLAVQAFIPIKSEVDVGLVVEELRGEINKTLNNDFNSYITGPAGFSADLSAAFSGIDGLLLIVALVAVFIILILVYRAVLLPFLVLFTSMAALCGALLTVWWLAKFEILTLTGQTQGILFILVVGAATDYALLYTARYREELSTQPNKYLASKKAVKASLGPIFASGSTVIAGLLCLLLSDLGSNKSLGPVASIGIVFAMAVGLTLLPAILLLTGKKAYWPRKLQVSEKASGYERIGQLVAKKPRRIWVSTALLLGVAALGVFQLKADGVSQSDLILTSSQARDGQEALSEHFPGSSGNPVYVITPVKEITQTSTILLAQEGVESLSLTTNTPGFGQVVVTEPLLTEQLTELEATVSNQSVLLQATLKAAPDSVAAENIVRQLRSETAPEVLIGGSAAISVDSNEAALHDRNLIIPIVLVVILIVLIFLLKSFLAPLLLVATTVLSFATALGVSALVFNHVFNFPGADPVVPLYGFVFLVALGIDYNIFLMTRVKEESVKHGTTAGVLRGLSATGGVITSAGIVLAATFAALAVIPILFLAQLAFIVAFGVLLDTFLVRTLLVPALGFDLSKRIWWPNRSIGD